MQQIERRQIRPPEAGGLLLEGLGALELPRLILRWPALLRLPRGEGRRVLVFPGYGAGDASTAPLRAFLSALGYRASGWGFGRNDGDVYRLLDAGRQRVLDEFQASGEPVRLVGWSLGGYLAREVARDLGHVVHRVVTLGSPVVGGPKYTALASYFDGGGLTLDEIEDSIDQRYARPLRVPVTAIYSKLDRVVAWQACIDQRSRQVEHIEVRTTHVGLGLSPDVYQVIGERLARPA